MSISADPKATIEFDAQSVTGSKITLKARFLTYRERKQLNEIIKAKIVDKYPDDPGVMEAAEEAIKLGIVTPFEEIAVLTPREICNLATSYRYVLDVSEIERGKSSSLLPSLRGKSAADAPEVAATSPTNTAP